MEQRNRRYAGGHKRTEPRLAGGWTVEARTANLNGVSTSFASGDRPPWVPLKVPANVNRPAEHEAADVIHAR